MKGKIKELFIAIFIISPLVFLGAAAALAAYTGPNRTVTTTTWERQYCNYRATVVSPAGFCYLTLYDAPGSCPSTSSVAGYFSPGPLACGSSWPGTCGAGLSCTITLLTGSTQSCAPGETACTQTTSTNTYPPATVSGTTTCTLPGNAGWCRGTATLNLSGNEPLAPAYNLTTFEGSPGTLCSAPACAWTFPEGNTSLNYWVHSTFGDTSSMASASMMVDSVAPILTLTIPPPNGANGWNVSAVTASASATDATSGVSGSASINGGGAAFTASTDGTYNLTATVSDVAGNAASSSGTIRLDTTPPVAGFSLPSQDGLNGWYVSSVTVAPNGSDATSGTASQEVTLDNVAWSSSVAVSTNGTQTVYERISDMAGNTTTSTRTIRLDTTPPSLSLSIPPADGSNGWFVSGPVTASASATDATSGVSGSASINGGGVSFTASADGTYNLTATVSDIAGNTASSSGTISLDTTPPSLSVSVPPADGLNGWFVSGPVTVSASATDATSGVNSLSINAGSSTFTASADGTYALSVVTTDNAGNSTSTGRTVRLDTTPPSLSISVPPADGSNGWYISPVTLTGSGSDATSGLASIQYRLDGGAWISGASLSVPNGVHVVEFQASDVAGNQISESHTIFVDTTPPTVTVTLPAPQGTAGWYTSGLQFSATGNDVNSGVQGIAYSLDGGATWQAGQVSLTEGRYTILTRVTDRAGNLTIRTNTVDVDPTPPQSAFTTPPEGSTTVIHGSFIMSGQTLDLTSGPAAAEISVDGGTAWQPLTIAGGTWSYTWDTNAVPNGTYTLLVRAGDVAGNEEYTARITVVVANQGPAVSITKTWWLWEQAEISIRGSILPVTGAQIAISDGQGHTRTYTFNGDNLPGKLKWDGLWDNGLYAPSGDFAVVVTAWDAFGNTGQDTGTVRIPAPLPTPTAEPPTAPAPTTEVPPPATVVLAPTVIPQVIPTPAPVPGPSKPQRSPSTPAIAPIYLWPTIGLVGLLAALASSPWADKRPSALHRLTKALTTAASGPEEPNQ